MESITVDTVDEIAIVTLCRPPINSLVKATYIELGNTFNALSERDDIRAVVLKADGRFFCPGNDVSEFKGVSDEALARAYAQIVSDGIAAVYNCKVPVVAAVHSHAFGAGMAIAACADILIASEDTQFAIPEIKVGVIGASGFLALLVPEKVVRYMSLSGNPISAQKVQEYGGVHKVVPTAQVFDTALEVARDLCKRSPTALKYFKAAMNANQDARLVEKYATEAEYTASFVGSGEWNESVNSFLENREPTFPL